MTSPAFIKQADLQRVANVAKNNHVMIEIISGGLTFRVYPEFTIPSPETEREAVDLSLY
ncbi:hypothetical protein B488_09080 [Liberibacter crescens BT-1]|uniref:Uncharacterized protein n=1 Tax=Liberibacter crescens (strain BT-1) TaxID=1215343 RepID=L0EVL4_LIBCB|nr:hypothetical protein [Liberibacter crescens]AGA64900.1 hypothetical protein B488_09080 [Liberibacter crescens BT-1]